MEDFGYRNLIVWQKAKTLVKLVYAEVKNFPVEERYALGDQIQRAVVSIPSNIAEGNGRTSNKDYAHFLSIARGSLYETLTQLEIAKDLGYASVTPEIEQLSMDLGYASVTPEIEQLSMDIGCILGAMIKKYGSFD